MQGYLVYNLNNGIEGKMSGLALLEAFVLRPLHLLLCSRSIDAEEQTARELIIHMALQLTNFQSSEGSMNAGVPFLTKVHGQTTETIPGCSRHWCKHMICSFNGLICSISYKSFFEKKVHMGIVIFNPITQEVLLLPQSRLSAEVPKISVAFGSRMNGYKVFRFFNPSGKSQDKHHECEVYSSITGSWKGIGSVAYNPSSSQHICIDGTVYWFIKSVRNGLIIGSILAVDMEENFSVIGIPVEATLYPFLDSKEFIWVKKCTAYMHAFNINKEVNHVTALKNKILFASNGLIGS
ncbi:hypothetical protein CK203_087741 [Vitis vinifera]|uniref:F-box associated beta-propeller type 3 domain-containing protein n=1 Tax=Vitis vinifera TaxID=29760 RepID=A0A438DPH9_VITVI|nr:hypothetical protein CK203_087741 [Vitis vinifera]